MKEGKWGRSEATGNKPGWKGKGDQEGRGVGTCGEKWGPTSGDRGVLGGRGGN